MEKPDLPDSCCRKETPACARGIYDVENKEVIPQIVFNQVNPNFIKNRMKLMKN